MSHQRIACPVVDVLEAPNGPRARQALLGAEIAIEDRQDGWLRVKAGPDGYPGYVPADSVAVIATPTHRVGTFATHVYAEEDMKSPDIMPLPFGAAVHVQAERRKFWETDLGYIPKRHLRPLDRPFTDPVTVAQLHFGVPYLWGGNSTRGIDCSGLVAAALRACDISSPGDSDQQMDELGQQLDSDEPARRGDLIFWDGHVGIMVDAEIMIHANAHHMAVAYEPLNAATLRIEAQGDGRVLARKRLDD